MTETPSKPGGGDGRPFWRRRWVWWTAGGTALACGLGLLVLRPFWKLSSNFEEIIFRQPSRLYAQPAALEVGRPYSIERVVKDLAGEGYRAAEGAAALAPGRYRASADGLAVHLRSFFLPDGSQGGSTLTQQVVKNIYLTQERKLARKVEEAVLAVMLELRYSKREILTAYLNEIYLGRSGGINVMGMGAASRAFFGKDASQLTLAEAATLAGIIPAPAAYSPLTHPERAKERRDWVLHRLEALGRVDKARIQEALAAPIATSPEPLARRRAPYFADAMAAEAARRFDIDDLADAGYSLYSTLSWEDQQAAQTAIDAGLAAAEKGYEKGNKASLQVALVSLQPATGGILAYVGGRRYDQSQFDRVSQAVRQTGSAFKPIVYATAFEEHEATAATFLEDEPLDVQIGNTVWSPKNDDGEFHGWVTVRTALEHSYNPATARLALQVGIPKIVARAHALGITTAMRPYPAIALGATAVAPIELATVYASLAAGGIRPPPHGLQAVVDSHGKRVAGEALPDREHVLSPQSAYLVTSLLQGVLERGTGAGSAWQLHGKLAGKTGTTNDRRDSWFAGYSPDRATVVWVGYDDYAVTRLSGSRAALPIWSRFAVAVTPPGGYATFPQPPGLASALIDRESGLLAGEFCPQPQLFTEFFRQGEVPSDYCNLHQSFSDVALEAPQQPAEDDLLNVPRRPPAEEARRPAHPFRNWLRRLFGGGGGGNGSGSEPPGGGANGRHGANGGPGGNGGNGAGGAEMDDDRGAKDPNDPPAG